jgi:hypothetical protein
MSSLTALRQRVTNVGSDRRQIDLLRRQLPGHEDRQTIRAIAIACSERPSSRLSVCMRKAGAAASCAGRPLFVG